MIDLRPLHKKPPIDVMVGDVAYPSGYIDSTVGAAKDVNSEASISRAVHEGLFEQEQNGSFGLYYYFNRLADFKDHMDNYTQSRLPPETYAKAQTLVGELGEDARIRARWQMVIARYRKQSHS